MKRIDTFVIILALVATAVAAVPFLYGVINAPQGEIYSGRHAQNSGDYTIYFSQMEQASDGKLLFHNLFTGEDHEAVIFNPFWLVLGWKANILGISIPIMFHIARLLLVPIFVLSAAWILSHWIQDRKVTRIALLLIVFAGGITGYAQTTDASFFNAMSFSPHLVASSILLFWILHFLARSAEAKSFRYAFYAGLLSLAVTSFHPYHIATIGILAVLYFGFLVWMKRNSWLRALGAVGIVGAFLIPATAYYCWLFNHGLPFGDAWLQQSDELMRVRTPWELLYSFFPLSVLGIAGLWIVWRRIENVFIRCLIVLWAVVPLIFMSLSVFFRMRMSGAVLIPLSVGTAFTFLWLWEKRKQILFKLVFFVSVAVVGVTLLWMHGAIFANNIAVYQEKVPHAYISRDLSLAFSWYEANATDQDVLLAPWEIANIVPSSTGKRIFIGHGIQTIDVFRKWSESQSFFANEISVQDAVSWMKQERISYVFISRGDATEKLLQNNPQFEEAYSNSGYLIFRRSER